MIAETETIGSGEQTEEMQIAEEKLKDLELPTGEKEVKKGTEVQGVEQQVAPQAAVTDTELLKSMNSKLDLLLAAQNVSEEA